MGITQFKIEMENVPGTLADLSNRLGYAGINIRGITIQPQDPKSTLYLVVNDPVAAERIFKESATKFEEERVIAVELPNVPGSLAACSKALADEQINILYIYPFIARTPNAIVILMTNDNQKSEGVLQKLGITMLTEEQLYCLE